MKLKIILNVALMASLISLITVSLFETVHAAEKSKLPAPTNIKASAGEFGDRIVVTWDMVSSAKSFYIYRSTSSNTGFVNLVKIGSLSYIDKQGTAGTKYYYKVSALDSAGNEGSQSEPVLGYIKAALPAPEGVKASQGDYEDKITISWKPVDGANRYGIKRFKNNLNSLEWTRYTEKSSTNTISWDQGVDPNVTYYYQIGAFADGGDIETWSQPVSGFLKKTDSAQPSSPTNVVASKGTYTGYIRVTWDPVKEAVKYRIMRVYFGTTWAWENLASTTDTFYNDKTAQAETEYYYAVTAVNKYGKEAFLFGQTRDFGIWHASTLPAPTIYKVTDGIPANEITITWAAVQGANTYNIYRSTSAETGFARLQPSPSTTAFSDTASAVNTLYYYKVSAVKDGNEGQLSPAQKGSRKDTTLLAPANFKASQGEFTDKIQLYWMPVDGAKEYNIYRSTSLLSGYALLAKTPTFPYVDRNVSQGSTYYYKLAAVDKQGKEGTMSSAIFGSLKAIPKLPAPANVKATEGAYRDKVNISWSPVQGAKSYNIYRNTSSSGSFPFLKSATATSYDDTTADFGMTYYYQVVGVDDKEGEFSLPVKGSKSAAQLPAPANVKASQGSYSDIVQVSWMPLSDAAKYIIYRSTASAGNLPAFKETPTAQYNDTSTSSGVTYYYQVAAVDKAGNIGARSQTVSGFKKK